MNNDKPLTEQMKELKNKFAELSKAMYEACKPISDFIIGFARILKEEDFKILNDKKNKRNNKRLHRIKRKLMRGTK